MSTIIIDDDLRTMTIPSDIVLLGVESDDDVNKIPFKMPKEYCGFDLSTFEARINYLNAHGDGDLYLVDDLAVDLEDPTMMTFTWLVGRNACAYRGTVQFIVCLKKFADDGTGTVLQEFKTTVYRLPVLQGLETTEAVVQENADVIEQILQRIDDSGMFDPTQYYTKSETDALIPVALPNPNALTLNGTSYDGSTAVTMDITATTIYDASTSGKLIHVVDAVPQAVDNLLLYDSSEQEVTDVNISITNKNLFRIDLISGTVTSKGITFTKQDDGSIKVNGTSTDTNAITSCNLNKYMFVAGTTYTLSSGKNLGFAAVQLYLTFTDNSTLTVIAKNDAAKFTVSKAVSTAVASVVVLDSGVTISNEYVYPQLEVGEWATTFVNNTCSEIYFDGVTMPELPEIITNLWAMDDSVANIIMEYQADTTYSKINNYVNENVRATSITGSLVAMYDGMGTVTIGVG